MGQGLKSAKVVIKNQRNDVQGLVKEIQKKLDAMTKERDDLKQVQEKEPKEDKDAQGLIK